MNHKIDYNQGAFATHPKLVNQLKKGNGRVFAHTNRALWLNEKRSLYSIHPLSKKRCGKERVYKDFYPSSLILKDVDTYFETKARQGIVDDVTQRIENCQDFSGVRRVVYGGLCGELWAIDDNVSVQDLLEDPSLDWKRAAFPQTFPNEKQYSAYLASDCLDTGLVDWETWNKFNQINSWFYFDGDSLVPFTQAKVAILLGSHEPTPAPRWGVFVLV